MEEAPQQHLAPEQALNQGAEGEQEGQGVQQLALESLSNLANIITGTKEEDHAAQGAGLEGDQGFKREGDEPEQPDAKRMRMEDPNTAAAMAAMAASGMDPALLMQHQQHQLPTDPEAAAAHAAAIEAAQQHAEAFAAMDPQTAAAYQAAAAGAALTPEQLAALQQMPMMMNPEMMAAAQASMGMQQAVGPDGQPIMPMMDPNQQQYFDPSAFGMNFNVDWMANLSQEQLQQLVNNPNLHQYFDPRYAMNQYQEGGNYKNWWDEKDENELLRFATDKEYCREKLGTEEMNWEKLEEYFGRSQNALRKKYWMLQKAQGLPPDPQFLAFEQAAAAAAANPAAFMFTGTGIPSSQPKQRAERKNWTEDETKEMARIVGDPLYRREQGFEEGEDDVSWERLAQRFACSVQTAKRKYRHLQEQAQQFGGVIPEKTKRQHFRKSVPYRWMIVSAMGKMAHTNYEATAPQIFETIEADPELQDQLDMRIMPGTKHVPRWKIQVRKVLSADHIFINTGVKQKHETIWRLDQAALQEANADRQRQRAGVAAISTDPSGAGQNGQMGGTDANGNVSLPIADLALMQQLQQMQQYMMPDGSMVLPPGGSGDAVTDAYLQQLQQLQQVQAGDPAAMAAAAAAWQTPEGAAALAAAQAMMPGVDAAAAAAMGVDMAAYEAAAAAAHQGAHSAEAVAAAQAQQQMHEQMHQLTEQQQQQLVAEHQQQLEQHLQLQAELQQQQQQQQQQ